MIRGAVLKPLCLPNTCACDKTGVDSTIVCENDLASYNQSNVRDTNLSGMH